MSSRQEHSLWASLGGVVVGDGRPVAVMGVLNVGPASFHTGSVFLDDAGLLRAAETMADAGAALIDIGARSTAPYGRDAMSETEETERLARAVALLAGKLELPLSADTSRPAAARAALDAGARVLNDIGGLADADLARLAAERGAAVIAMAGPSADLPATTPLATVRTALARSVARAAAAGIAAERLVLDPGIGFFRAGPMPWHAWDSAILAGLPALRDLGQPLAVGVSRKSFIGALTGREATAERLAGSLAATAAAVLGGVALIRTHDVPETIDAVRVAERLREVAR